jgi:hypothetical protein
MTFLAILWLLGAEPGNTPTVAAPAQLAAADYASMSMSELIKHLPPAGMEFLCGCKENPDGEHPASKELNLRLRAGAKLGNEEWRDVLLATGAVRFRRKWPRNESYAVSITKPVWLDIAEIRLKSDLPSLREAKGGSLQDGSCIPVLTPRTGIPIGILPPGTTELTFDVVVERGESGYGEWRTKLPPPGIVWRGSMTIPVELVENIEAAIPSASGADLDEAVRESIGAAICKASEDNKPHPFLTLDPDCSRFPALAYTALDLKVELMQDGRVLGESLLWADENEFEMLCRYSVRRNWTRFYGTAGFERGPDAADTSGWVLRVSGRAEHVGEIWSARQWWSGTIEIPWAEAMRNEAARRETAHRFGLLTSCGERG